MMLFEVINALDKAIAQELDSGRVILDAKVAKEAVWRLREMEKQKLANIEAALAEIPE